MEEILKREGELEEKIEGIDHDSRSIIVKDGAEPDMLEKIKEFFPQVPEILQIINNKKKEL